MDKLNFFAEYNEFEYSIYNSKSELVYRAGNSPFDSQQFVSAEDGVGIEKMREYAIYTGNNFADDMDGVFIGAEFVPY